MFLKAKEYSAPFTLTELAIIGIHQKPWQGRLPKELALNGITDMDAANEYLKNHYLPTFNQEFSRPEREEGNAFVELAGVDLNDYLCQRFERVVRKDNCVQFNNLNLQLPKDNIVIITSKRR